MNHLIIGNKNYSSWSLRPWILLREKNIPFKETKIPLYLEGSKKELLKYTPSGKVPSFIYDKLQVWDSLAICETIAELYPEKNCWPNDLESRAMARSISNEMHSGFSAIRNTLPMNCRKSMVFEPISAELQMEIDRILEIWRSCRTTNSTEGSFLFGSFTIADAMFIPIVLRFNSYGIKVGKLEQSYMNSMLELSALKEWIAEGIQETEVIVAAEVEQ